MLSKYLIVSKEILPDYYDKVIEARNLIDSGKAKGVSEAVKKVGISRSTYYKYKDYVFAPSGNVGRKATLSLMLEHHQGILSNLLNVIAEKRGNILTINQDIPINNIAIITITLDVLNLNIPVEELIETISITSGVASIKLIAIE
ncbi:MAG: ACT domain-containing protein [Eubacteriales bacterium]